MSRPDLTVVIVNFNSASLSRELVRSLQNEEFEGREGKGRLEIIVVDNASPRDESSELNRLREWGVRVEYSPENLGYGGGCNLGAKLAQGEFLMIMNPDVLLVPGAIQCMINYLRENPQVGQVGPRGWFDATRFFYLPSIELPTIRAQWRMIAARQSRRWARNFARRRTRHALRVWTADQPLNEEVIAGYAFMMRTDLALEMGPFDEAYPFYFEDSDLSRRLRDRGLRCVLHTGAEMIHFYNKSAGQVYEEAMKKHGTSQRKFFEHHYGEQAALLTDFLPAMVSGYGDLLRGWTFAKAIDMGDFLDPPEFTLPRYCRRYLAEVTLDPMFALALGHVGEGDTFRIGEGGWDALEGATFYVRFFDLEGLEDIGTYKFRKIKPIAEVPGFDEFLRRLNAGEARSL